MKKNFNQLLHCVPRYFRKIFTIYRGNIAVAFPLRNTLQQLNFKSIRNYQLWLALKNDDQQAANDNTDCGIFIGGPLNIIITDSGNLPVLFLLSSQKSTFCPLVERL